MACLNSDQNQAFFNSIIGPRISFSNDFADLQHPIALQTAYTEAPVSSDFAFSVPTDSVISADELFFNGKMLPLGENAAKTTTLRDELLARDDDYEEMKMAKGTSRWKQRFGLKRALGVVPKKCGRNMERIDEVKVAEMVFEDVFGNFRR